MSSNPENPSTNWSTLTRAIVLVVVLILLFLVAWEARPLIGSLIIAALLAYVLNLGVRSLTSRTNLSRKWSANIIFIVFLLFVIATPGTLVPVAVRQVRTLSIELEEVNRQIESLVGQPLVVGDITIPVDQLWDDLTGMTTDFGSTFEGAIAVVEATSNNLIRLVIIVVVSYYLLVDWHGLRKWLMNILPKNGRPDAQRLFDEIDHIWQAYLQGTLALMIIVGLFFIIVGLAIGLPGAIAVGFLTGFLSMIPEVGPWISGIIAVLIAYFAGSNHLPISNLWFALLVAGIYLVVTQVKSIWLRPKVMRRFMHLNTGVVFLAIIAAAILQGILAALIVLPLLATVGVLGRYIRARLLNIEPWPAKHTAEQNTGIAAENDAEPEESV